MAEKHIWPLLSQPWEGIVVDVGSHAGGLFAEAASRGGSGKSCSIEGLPTSGLLEDVGQSELRLIRFDLAETAEALQLFRPQIERDRPVIVAHRAATPDKIMTLLSEFGYVVDGPVGRLATWWPAHLHTIVIAYDRPTQLSNLVADLGRERKLWTSVHIFDDVSSHSMAVPAAAAAEHGFRFSRLDTHHGKLRFWKLWSTVLGGLRQMPEDTLFVTLPDDVRLCSDFAKRCLLIWNGIGAADRTAVNLMAETRRDKVAQWTGYAPKRISDNVWRTQWVDGWNLMGHRALRAVDYKIAQPGERRFDNPNISSGVWQWFSQQLHRQKLGIYRVHRSLLVHVAGRSVMHRELRQLEPIVAANYVDGKAAHNRLLLVEPAYASLASIPSRVGTLQKVVDSLLPQVDRLRVYLNGYNEVPRCLLQPNIDVARSQEHGDRGDAGKFFWCEQAHGYQIICDDDLVYPVDHVKRMVDAIERFNRRAVVSLHGVILLCPCRSYYKDRRALHWRMRLDVDIPCHVLGTGVMAYHASAVRVRCDDFRAPNMADIWMARVCEAQRVPRVCIAHPPETLNYMEPGWTIYRACCCSDAIQTKAVNEIMWSKPCLPK